MTLSEHGQAPMLMLGPHSIFVSRMRTSFVISEASDSSEKSPKLLDWTAPSSGSHGNLVLSGQRNVSVPKRWSMCSDTAVFGRSPRFGPDLVRTVNRCHQQESKVPQPRKASW